MRLLRPILSRSAGALLAVVALAQPAADIRVNVNLVRVLATVKDPSGQLVGSLPKEDFTILDNGVPQDVSIAAICPNDEAERLRLPATSASLPVEELARTAVRLLAGQVNGETVASVTILPPTLKIRDTTAPAPAEHPGRP